MSEWDFLGRPDQSEVAPPEDRPAPERPSLARSPTLRQATHPSRFENSGYCPPTPIGLPRINLMARIEPLAERDAKPASLEAMKATVEAHGRLTNMKRTLAHSPVALRALMTWYDLRDEVVPFLGERPTILFAHAISSQTDCLICSTFFRRILIEAGDDPDHIQLTDVEQTLVDFGRQLAADPNAVSEELYSRISAFLDAEQIVTLTAFGALMIATNLFNNALRVDLDEYLYAFRKPEDHRS
jgi:alkylhydroperoxidase family enzyme